MSIVENPLTNAAELTLPDVSGFEVVDGQLVEKNVGQTSSFIGGELFFYLRSYCGSHQLGSVFPADSSFDCGSGGKVRIRRPDVAFVGNAKLARYGIPAGQALYAPDLAAEVISPKDLAEEIADKVNDYLAAGVQLVWILDPTAKKVQVYRPDGRGVILSIHDELDGEDVVPGFRCKLAQLFDAPALKIKPKLES
jgi:Uma2 family endonuclease